MWLLVLFDLPTQTKAQRRAYFLFRQRLVKDGFEMVQFSVYRRITVSLEENKKFSRRVRRIIPPEGYVMMVPITNKQFEMIEHFHAGRRRRSSDDDNYSQLKMF